ncbi:MAG: peptidoglycan DD-metalloendopeptidase family protein [Myxococcales bacterium]|nr:peptidoglycan DD-metalloendopeptidase family protein [Myxococcales bacterium]
MARIAAASLPLAAALALAAPGPAQAAECAWAFPVGTQPESPAPLADNHPVGGMNLPEYGAHLGGDYWSGGGCTDLGQPVYAAADGEIVEIVDNLGSYLDVVVIRHAVPEIGPIYTMYGHIARDPGLSEGAKVARRQKIGEIADVLQYFSPCHLHFEILNESAYQNGPFCSGCQNAGYHVSPGYDQKKGVTKGTAVSGDEYLEVNDGVADNRWYFTDAFVEARLDQTCGACGDGMCDAGEDFENCPADCDPCQWIPPPGTTLGEDGPCFSSGGNPKYWYPAQDAGHDGSLLWTHTTDSDMVDNYGVWELVFQESGDYEVEIYADPAYAQSKEAAYIVAHAGVQDVVAVDQGAAGGWASLGIFHFNAGGGQSLRLNDNTGEPFADKVQIVFDAVRVTRVGEPDTTSGGDTSTSGGSTSTSGSDGGSSDGGSGSGGGDGGATDTGGSGDSAGSSVSESGFSASVGGDGEAAPDGCACRSAGGRGSLAPLGLLGLVALIRRRRRV